MKVVPGIGRWVTWFLLLPGLLLFFAWRQHQYNLWGMAHHGWTYFLPALVLAAVIWGLLLLSSEVIAPRFLRGGSPALGLLLLLGLAAGAAALVHVTGCDCNSPAGDGFAILLALALGSAWGLYRQEHRPAPAAAPRTPHQSELQYLRDQVNPHFLFNTLNSIYGLAKQQSDRTPEVVHQLSTLLRYQLETAQLETVSLRQELDFIQDYLLLEDTRLGDRCDIEFELSRQPARYVIYPMLLLPLVENAFKHGANSSRGRHHIHVVAEVQNGRLTFRVTNSRAPDVKIAGTGTGLANLRRRLELLYPNGHQLTLDDRVPARYRGELQLDLHAG